MVTEMKTEPVNQTGPKVNDELEVGIDLDFQKRWWRFEKIIWVIFTIIILLDMLGAFGHGILAKARLRSPDGSVDVDYERVERFSAASKLMVHFTPAAIHDGKVRLWLNDAMLTDLGTQRVITKPLYTTLDNH